MTFAEFVKALDDFAWGPIMLVLLVGTGIFLSIRVGFIQFSKLGYALKHTLGKAFKKVETKTGEITPFQALTTALAGTVGTGNIAGVTGAIAAGGPGAVFWMWISALFGMVTKYSEVTLSIKYREKNEKGDWVGGPMYYIKNGLGKGWGWLAVVFAVLGALCAFGIGNVAQVNSIAEAINTALDVFGAETATHTIMLFGSEVVLSSFIIGIIIAVVLGLVLIGGIKGIGRFTEKIVPFMAVVYVLAALVVIFGNVSFIGKAFAMIFQGAFSPSAVLGGAVGVTIKVAIQKGVARGVFSNEAGLGSAPMAHAASSETDPVKQGLYGIFEVFMDTIIICTITALSLLCGTMGANVEIGWGHSAGPALVIQAFSSVFGGKAGALIIAICLTLFALSTVLSWALYGARCAEFIFKKAASVKIYQLVFLIIVITGPLLTIDVVWDLADAMNGLMAIPNLIALLGLSGVVVKLTKEYFAKLKDERL